MVHRSATALAASLCAAAAADAQLVNSWGTFLRYFNDIPSSNVQITNNTLNNLTFHEDFPQAPAGAGGINRHTGALSPNNGVSPFVLNNAIPWSYEVTVRLDGLASNEAGMHIGQLGTPAPYGPGNAITGQVMVNANGEIAAFGAWLPFFSNNQPQYSHLPRGARGQDFRLGVFVNPNPGSPTIEYRVNGISTGLIPIDGPTFNFYNSLQNTLGVYGQGGWRTTGPTDATYIFTNPVVVPAPAGAALLALAGVLGSRRRRR